MTKVFIQTYGCQMNVADSDEMFTHLAARGAEYTDQLDEADIVLVNTCTVRDHAEHRAVSFLGRLAAWKKERPHRVIIFAGCAAERLGAEIQKKYPFLDILSGAKDIEHFSDRLDASGLFAAPGRAGEAPAPGLTGYVTIMRGCDFACSYCIVPSVRGPVKCLPAENILKEAAQKAAAGAKEIMLLGQTVNAYRDGQTSFADLLNRVSEVPGVERVRFTSPHPIYFTPAFLEAVKNNPKIARNVHLPVQSGSTKVLQEMKRGYTREIFLDKVRALKACGFTISTDIIVGFPTETEEDFRQTLSLVDEAEFFAAYCFKYSPRRGTPAAQMKLLDKKVLEERLDILLNRVRGLSDAAYQTQVGTVKEVLLESENKGRSSENFWVKTHKSYPVGSIVRTEIEKADGTLLFARD
ncbi:tRNA (N6-isopentenyl adenosine(37)-C2)-methylthiotransferase MiaB [Candidatus Avelusimicrobium alvi]|uniref:tRNA (N6-isopentenyl adenosine(37)-C2)-methylthiotransferase MiaB n=1 Tax=Candidatus Avelusimicrobium alvi TaxID=3416221 RepID=UPI003D0B52A8